MEDTAVQQCPVLAGRDDRKSAAYAETKAKPAKGSTEIRSFAALRDIFRSPDALQGMAGEEAFGPGGNPDHMPVIFLNGEAHRRRRTAIARYFTPKAITTRYHDVIHAASDRLIAELVKTGSADLDVIAFQLAVDVTAEVVGLTNSDNREQAQRLHKMLSGGPRRPFPGSQLLHRLLLAWRMQGFYRKDVAPAVEARRSAPREDVISHMIKENYSKKAMLIECMIYGTAGMVTTRELITMAAWHMLDDEALRLRYINGSEDDQFAIIEEILRLEPIVGMLYRKVPEQGDVSLNIRAANLDEAVTGPCPHALDPDRARRMKVSGSYMSFGDGPHRCPGAQLALHEARVFLDKLLRVPGITLARKPSFAWIDSFMGYELRDAVVSCDRA